VGGASGTGGSGGGGGSAQMAVEKALDVALALAGNALTITVKEGTTAVMTDAWLYTLQGETLTPLTDFQDPASKRRYRGLMMPCTLSQTPSNLTPCDDGVLNGVLTDSIREKIVNGVRQSAIDGTVTVTLNAAPVDPIVVVVAREDQRYAGAAAISPDGTAATVPAGIGTPETHKVVSFASDIAPLLGDKCTACHSKNGINPGFPLKTYDDVVNFDFGYGEEVAACEQQFPNDPTGLETCKNAITKVEYMIELGVPALSPLMRRARPDEEKSVSTVGLAWYGSSGSRFGSHGDRRMPPSNITPETADDEPVPTYFDENPGMYQLLWDWVSQGASK
jgi:hypothetical protein